MARSSPIRHHRPGQSIGPNRIRVKVVFVPVGGDARNTISAYFTITQGVSIERLLARANEWLADFLVSGQQSTPLRDVDDYEPVIAPTLAL